MSKFSTLHALPADPIYGMQALFKNDNRPEKINLSIGVCKELNGTNTTFHAVQQATEQLHAQKRPNEYLPLTGYQPFCDQITKLVCGKAPTPSLFCMQTVGGTGALYVAAKLLLKTGTKELFVSEPSWPNHRQLFEAAGLLVKSYPYYNKKEARLLFTEMLEAISRMPIGSAIALQASCHNPTGSDLTKEQWQALASILQERHITPLFDLAYQGFGEGLNEDTYGIRLFLEAGIELFIATTLAKNLGLYNERVGALIVHGDASTNDRVASHAKNIVRCCYSSPPAHGVHIAALLLENEQLQAEWRQQLEKTRRQIIQQRELLFLALQKTAPPFVYEHIPQTKGLFCLLDIPHDRIERLREKEALYIAQDGRICVAAVTEENVATIAQALSRVIDQ